MADRPLQETFDTVRVPAYEETYDIHQVPGAFQNNAVYQHYLNCFPVVARNNVTGEGEVYVTKRNGYAFTNIDLNSALTGATNNSAVDLITMTQLSNIYVAAIFDATNSKHVILSFSSAGTVVKIGEITSTAATDFLYLTELTIAGVPYLGVIWHNNTSTNSKGYFALTSGGVFSGSSLTEITDGDFPTGLTGPMVQMNDIVYVLTKAGKIHNSDANSIADWTANAPPSAAMYPDRAVSLARYKHHICVFGEDSIEFWNDEGTPPPASPLRRTDQAFIKFGAAGPKMIVTIDDNIYWIALSSSGTAGLWKLDGYTPTPLTGPAEENIITSGNLAVSQMRVCTFQNNKCLMLNSEIDLDLEKNVAGSPSTYVNNQSTGFGGDPHGDIGADQFTSCHIGYNIDSNCWFYFRHATGATLFPLTTKTTTFNPAALGQNSYVLFAQRGVISGGIARYVHQVIDSSTGTQGIFDDDTLTAATGNAITCAIGFNARDFGNLKKKRIARLRVVQRAFTGNDSNLNAFPYVWVLYMRDDWTQRPDSAGNKRVFLRNIVSTIDYMKLQTLNLGAGRRWAFVLVNRSKGSWQVKGLELDLAQFTA